jgi:hypothetical protein
MKKVLSGDSREKKRPIYDLKYEIDVKWQCEAFSQLTKFDSKVDRSLYIVIRVNVWVSIADSPSIVFSDFMNVASGANSVAPQASKCSAESEIMTYKGM